MNPSRKLIFIVLISILVAGAGIAFVLLSGADKTSEISNDINETINEGNPPWAIIIPVMVAIIGLSLVPFFKIFFPGTIKNGVTAEATVLKVWDTGVSINDNPQIGLLLEVHPLTGTTFQVEAKKVVSRLNTGVIQPGVKVKILYDPSNIKRVLVQSFQEMDSHPTNTEIRLRELQDLREKSLITLEEYEKKREEILKAL